MNGDSNERLVASLVHELRNPLFALSATLDAYESLVEHDPAHVDYVHAMRQQIVRLTDILSGLAQWARPIELRTESRSHAELILRAVAEVEPIARRKGVRVETSIEDRTIQADSDTLTRAFASILDIAIGRSKDVVRVTLHDTLTISDSGGSLSHEDLARIFEPMYKPFGVALAMAYRIVIAHGGSMEASNTDGGIAIAIRLP